MRRLSLLFLLLSSLGSSSSFHPSQADKAADKAAEIVRDTQTARAIVFARLDTARGVRELHLTLVRPAILPPKPLPILIWVHGGLWRSGDATKLPPLVFELARRGYACAGVEFRSSKEAVFPAQLDDLRAATRFLRANAPIYSLDARKIGVAGISTGAQLGALLALGGGATCAIDICGPSDLTVLSRDSRLNWDGENGALRALLGGSPQEKPEIARAASPLFRVGKNPPPFLILHGEDDSLVALSQSEALFERLKTAGGAVTYRIYRGEEHGLRGAKPETEAEIVTFLGKWLPR